MHKAAQPLPETKTPLSSPWARAALALLAVLLLGALASRIDFRHDLHRLDARMLSGAREGNYHAVVDRLAQRASARRGHVENLPSEGSADNVNRLIAAEKGCEAQFALVQEGTPWQAPERLSLVARLVKPEAVLMLGKKGDAVRSFNDLTGARIGIGPSGGGTARVAERIFAGDDMATLGIKLSHHSLSEQLDLAARGDLDFALVVIDDHAPLVQRAVRELGLSVASVPQADAIARKVPYLRAGDLFAGEYDAARPLPASNRRVLFVDTLVIANRCASRSTTIGLLDVLSHEMPDLVRHNRASPNTSGLREHTTARAYLEAGGPEPLDLYAPWLTDLMPPGNFAYLVMAVSLLFNAMGFGHRFRLWRLDVARVDAEAELVRLFPTGTAIEDIGRLEPGDEFREEGRVAALRAIIATLELLAVRCRRESLSMLVPMGQEMAYRYQEEVIDRTLGALHAFEAKLLPSNGASREPAAS